MFLNQLRNLRLRDCLQILLLVLSKLVILHSPWNHGKPYGKDPSKLYFIEDIFTDGRKTRIYLSYEIPSFGVLSEESTTFGKWWPKSIREFLPLIEVGLGSNFYK